MNCFLIGIGGTGAKVAESALHLLASGILRTPGDARAAAAQAAEYSVGFIDSDEFNGTRARVRAALRDYAGFHPGVPATDFLGPRITEHPMWNPAPGQNRTFASFLGTDPAALGAEPAQLLCRACFDVDLMHGSLDVGFRGAPSLGTLVLTRALEEVGPNPPALSLWERIDTAVEEDNAKRHPTRIVLAGSVFGGMGAAGLPAVAKFLRQRFPRAHYPQLQLAFAAILPHFKFPTGKAGDSGAYADYADFIATSKNTLLHYIEHKIDADVDAIYVVGSAQQTEMPLFAIGKGDQRNPAHYIDLYAALGAVDFWRRFPETTSAEQQAKPYRRINRAEYDEGATDPVIRWESFPWLDATADPQRMTRMVRFALALNRCFAPRLSGFIERKFEAVEAPWIRDFFGAGREQLEREKAKLIAARNYTCAFLLWLAEVQDSIGVGARSLDNRLVNPERFSQRRKTTRADSNVVERVLDLDGDSQNAKANTPWTDLYPASAAAPTAASTLSEVWSRLSSRDPRDAEGPSPIDEFLRKCYLDCG